MPLIDVVNFNGDASCLSSSKWLRCLEGGRDSLVARVLTAYVRSRRKVNLGFVGATIMDLVRYNPEAIEIVNEHPDVFEIVGRPFAHDNGLLRLPAGFRTNVEHGIEAIRRHFKRVNGYFLAPEIMITGEQIRILRDLGFTGVFLHKGRYDVSVSRHVPDAPFVISGVLGSSLNCLPFAAKDLETKYLHMLHGTFTPEQWASEVSRRASNGTVAIWRDGESCLLHPLAPRFESEAFAAEDAGGVARVFLSSLAAPQSPAPAGALRYFPMHSMRPWLDSMKLYWYIGRVNAIERELEPLSNRLKRIWLLTINSDILSAAEKSPPVVAVSEEVLNAATDDYLWDGVLPVEGKRELILTRSERAGEGEDYLAYLEMAIAGELSDDEICRRWASSSEPHLRKALARVCG